MTSAPPCLLTARSLLLAELGPHGLPAAAVGIVGDKDHRGGYHCGEDRVVDNDYSARVSRDKAGLSDFASALDIGSFRFGAHNLRTFSVWLVAECEKGAADTRDIREVIYTPDGKNVKRWDRERRSSTGDDSHLWHTHVSYYRDATKANRDLTAVYRRYLTTIGLIKAPQEVSDMDATQARKLDEVHAFAIALRSGMPKTADGRGVEPVAWRIRDEAWQRDVSARLSGPAPAVDATAVAVALAGNADFVAAIARAVADEHARRMAQ